MENRDKIVRQLNALKAKFEHPATNEAEALAAMNKYNELMSKYRLTETDLGIRNSEINAGEFHTHHRDFDNELAPLCWLIKPISMVTETKGICVGKVTGLFVGLGADVQHAEFLWNRLNDALLSTVNAFEGSPRYNEFKGRGFTDREVKTAFIAGWLQRMTRRLLDMVPESREISTNALVLLKTDLIERAMGADGATQTSGAIVKTGHSIIEYEGGIEAEKVALRKEAGQQTKYLTAS